MAVFCSHVQERLQKFCRNLLFLRSKKNVRVPRALAASSGLAPWSMTADRIPRLGEYLIEERGSRGLAPLGCLPLWGREGVTLAIRYGSTKSKTSACIPALSEGKIHG